MKNQKNPVALWGPGLIVVGFILLLIGYIGAPMAEQKRRDFGSNRFHVENEVLGTIWLTHFTRMKEMLRSLEPQVFQVASESATGPLILTSDELNDLMQSTLSAAENDVVQQFPARPYILQIRMALQGAGDYTGIEHPYWDVLSEGLSQEARNRPDSIVRGYIAGSVSQYETINFPLPDREEIGRDEYRRASTALQYYFPETPLMVPDVAGNMVPKGTTGRIFLRFYMERNDTPARFYSILISVLHKLGLFGLILMIVTPPVWVFLDARRRRLPAVLWGLFSLPTSFLGALIYALVVRDLGPSCPECGERISTRFVVCPYCQNELKGTCSTCGQTVGQGWHYCPSCSTEI